MTTDPQGIVYFLGLILVAASGKLFQLGSNQGRLLRKARRRIENLEKYIYALRLEAQRDGIALRPFPEELNYMNPKTEESEDDDS